MMNNITNDKPIVTGFSNKSGRELLIENVQNWVILDQQLHNMNEKTKQIRELKTNTTTNICKYMKSNNITTNIGISNGELRIYDKKEYKPLTFTYVERCLTELIKDKSHVESIIKYLKDNRELNISQDIKRISTKL
jgi:spore germination protein YaaH